MDRLKLGSLFDGSGGFPLGGLLCGIEPVWASEVEPFPIRVRKSVNVDSVTRSFQPWKSILSINYTNMWKRICAAFHRAQIPKRLGICRKKTDAEASGRERAGTYFIPQQGGRAGPLCCSRVQPPRPSKPAMPDGQQNPNQAALLMAGV